MQLDFVTFYKMHVKFYKNYYKVLMNLSDLSTKISTVQGGDNATFVRLKLKSEHYVSDIVKLSDFLSKFTKFYECTKHRKILISEATHSVIDNL